MKKTLLNEVNRFKKLAGLLKEDDYTEDPNLIPSGDTDAMSIAEDEEDSKEALPVDTGVVSTEDDIDDEKRMSPAEKASVVKGFQLLSMSQMAGLYLKALEEYEKAPGKYLVMIPNIEVYGQKDKTGAFRVSMVNLGNALRVSSPETVTRTVKKFKNILSKVGHTESEFLYPKIIRAAEKFKKMNPRDIAIMAGSAVPKDPGIMDTMPSTERRRIGKVGGEVNTVADQLDQRFNDLEKSRQTAITLIAYKRKIPRDKIQADYDLYLQMRR